MFTGEASALILPPLVHVAGDISGTDFETSGWPSGSKEPYLVASELGLRGAPVNFDLFGLCLRSFERSQHPWAFVIAC